MSVIAELRALGTIDGTTSSYGGRDERLDDIDCILDPYKPEGYLVKVVQRKSDNDGRWSYYETKIYEVTEGEEVAYFEWGQERPATEMQDGMDLGWHFHEAEAYEVKVTKYRRK